MQSEYEQDFGAIIAENVFQILQDAMLTILGSLSPHGSKCC